MTNENGRRRQAESRSVIERPDPPSSRSPVPSNAASQLYWFVNNYADDVTPWGVNVKARDKQLRNFIMQENIFASALGIICNRNAGFSWKLDGPLRTTGLLQTVFDTANMGEGWHSLIIKTSVDFYTQDNGAFWEIVRLENNSQGTIIGINHLDSAQCYHTGNPEFPVIYMDKMGKAHLLPWFSVVVLSELPTPIETLYGQQYSALSRLLRSAQTHKNMAIFDNEKTAGRNTKAIHLVKGVTTQQITDAMSQVRSEADASGLMRFMNPVVVGTMDPTADVGHDTINLVAKPDDFDAETAFKHYINLISMAFASDYQEFAPLPGGGLGTGNQSEILHLKNRGKGPGIFMKCISHAVNFRVLPKNIHFFFDEQDLEAEKSDAEVRAIRAQTRATRIQSGEITPQIARQIANDEGDLFEEYLTALDEEDLVQDTLLADDVKPDQLEREITPNVVRRPDPDRTTARQPNPTASRPREPQRRNPSR
jgi:hypothetical protein